MFLYIHRRPRGSSGFSSRRARRRFLLGDFAAILFAMSEALCQELSLSVCWPCLARLIDVQAGRALEHNMLAVGPATCNTTVSDSGLKNC